MMLLVLMLSLVVFHLAIAGLLLEGVGLVRVLRVVLRTLRRRDLIMRE